MDHTERIKEILNTQVEDKRIKVKVSLDGLKTIIEAEMDEGLRYRMIEDYLHFIISHLHHNTK